MFLYHRSLRKQNRPFCGAKCRDGHLCQARVVVTQNGIVKRRCRMHGGLSTGPKTIEGLERIAEAQRRRWSKSPSALLRREKVNNMTEEQQKAFTFAEQVQRITRRIAVLMRTDKKRVAIDVTLALCDTAAERKQEILDADAASVQAFQK